VGGGGEGRRRAGRGGGGRGEGGSVAWARRVAGRVVCGDRVGVVGADGHTRVVVRRRRAGVERQPVGSADEVVRDAHVVGGSGPAEVHAAGDALAGDEVGRIDGRDAVDGGRVRERGGVTGAVEGLDAVAVGRRGHDVGVDV